MISPAERAKKKIKMKSKTDEIIEAGGGIVYRETGKGGTEIVLIKRRGLWDLPKGKKEDDESASECAIREVSEEIGVRKPEIEYFLTDTYHEYREGEKLIGKTTHWYLMTLADSATEFIPQTDEQIEEVQWMPVKTANEIVGYSNLKKVLKEVESQKKA